jgi:hypothetical protein
MKIQHKILSLAIMSLFMQFACAQGFVNLDFEDAIVDSTPPNVLGNFIDPAIAFPGWTVGGNYTVSFYNDISLGASAVCLVGPEFPNVTGLTSLQGSYSVLFQYFGYPEISPPTLSQTGLIPAGTQSISMLGGALLSLNGVNIPLVPAPDGRLAGDISSFAGSIAQLTLSTAILAPGFFDDIQFSPSPVPEPVSFSLIIICVLFAWRFKRFSFKFVVRQRNQI